MKGICQCCDCVYYNMKQHKCNRGCKAEPELSKDEDVRFFVDCPLPEVEAVKHGEWKEEEPRELVCSLCGKYAPMNFMHQHCVETAYCPHCGARMDGDKK